MFTTRITRRTAVAAAAVVGALTLAGATTLPALAAPHPAVRTGATTIREGDPSSAVDRVADFYGAYIDVRPDDTGIDMYTDLRRTYLTTGLQKKLAAWEAVEHADGVLRAQDTPSHWRVTSDGAGAGHVFTTVTLTWGSVAHPDYTYLKVSSDLSTGLISDIEQG